MLQAIFFLFSALRQAEEIFGDGFDFEKMGEELEKDEDLDDEQDDDVCYCETSFLNIYALQIHEVLYYILALQYYSRYS